MERKKNVLFISYLFPPIGGSGVQRKLKYVKYLSLLGWNVYVLTVKPITYYTYDATLLEEVPPQVDIIRTESLDPLRLSAVLSGWRRRSSTISPSSGYKIANRRMKYPSHGSSFGKAYRFLRSWLMFPDNQAGWIPFAIRQGLAAIRDAGVDVIVAAAHPSAGIVAHELSRRTQVPYLIDLADGWTDNPYTPMPSSLHRYGHQKLERRVIGGASMVTTYSDWLADRLVRRYPQLAGRVKVLPNGFDPADFEQVTPKDKMQRKMRIVYMGSLYEHQETNYLTFLRALTLLSERDRAVLEVLFVGNYYAGALTHLDAFDLQGVVQFIGYVTHSEALSYLISANAALLFVRPGDISMVTGKLFEYLGARVPILACIEPKSIAASILWKAGLQSLITGPFDSEVLSQNIAKLINGNLPRPIEKSIVYYDRRHQAERLSNYLEQLIQMEDV